MRWEVHCHLGRRGTRIRRSSGGAASSAAAAEPAGYRAPAG